VLGLYSQKLFAKSSTSNYTSQGFAPWIQCTSVALNPINYTEAMWYALPSFQICLSRQFSCLCVRFINICFFRPCFAHRTCDNVVYYTNSFGLSWRAMSGNLKSVMGYRDSPQFWASIIIVLPDNTPAFLVHTSTCESVNLSNCFC
jgi:hypothetical protein